METGEEAFRLFYLMKGTLYPLDISAYPPDREGWHDKVWPLTYMALLFLLCLASMPYLLWKVFSSPSLDFVQATVSRDLEKVWAIGPP